MPAAADGAKLERVESYQYPSGHVGHLTENQLATLQKFKDLCSSKGYYTAATDSTPASHDDETLLRYLRARKFIPQEAYNQLKDTEDWRKENQLDTLYDTIDVEEYDATRRLYPQWLGRRDKRGIPVYLFEVAQIDMKAVTANAATKKGQSTLPASKEPPKMMRLFALYENMCRFVLPLCSNIGDRAYPETPVSQSNNIVDISNVGLRQFWNLKAHMQDASLLATAHYPETLDRIFLIGAPSFFPTVWGWVKRWFDPITVSKIFILSASEVKPTLLQYMDEENIPVKYGGKLDFKFGDMPILEPAIADSLDWQDDTRKGSFRSLPTGPIKWQKGENGNMQAMAVGTVNGTRRNLPIGTTRPKAAAPTSTLAPPRSNLIRTTTGEATHPPTPPAGTTDVNPYANDDKLDDVAGAGATTAGAGKVDDSVIPNATVNKGEGKTYLNYDNLTTGNTSTLPIREPTNSQTSPSTSDVHNPEFKDAHGERTAPPEVRQGTSSTRFEQQGHTHASDQLADGTPEVRHMGHGDKVQVMEPNTIGQAPKEHPIPEPEEPQPSMVDQAKNVAGAAASYLPASVLSAVGLGGQQAEEIKKDESPKQDTAVDSMDERKVEEFLRAKNMSKPQPPGSQN